MATRRRDAGNSDLKARLGIQDAPEEAPVSEAPAAVDEGASVDSSAGAIAAEAGYGAYEGDFGAAASESAFAGENYADVAEEDLASKAPPKADWRDSEEFKAPPPQGPNKRAVAVGVVAAVVGIGMGFGIGQVAEANGIYNMQTEHALQILDPVSTSATRIAALKGELEAKPTDRYDASIDELLASAFAPGSGLVLSPASLNAARMVLSTDTVGGPLTTLLATLQTLEAVVKRHFTLTQVDLLEIQRELAGAADQTKFAIVFDVRTMQARYQAHTENPDPLGYQLVAGIRVPFPDDAEVKEVRQGQGVDYYYELRMPDGKDVMIPIYGLVSIDKAQLESGGRVETAQMRWIARVKEIREAIVAVEMLATRTTSAVEEVSGRAKRFAF